ncbi:hypothetical protein D3C85_1179090 [compost metagenome]
MPAVVGRVAGHRHHQLPGGEGLGDLVPGQLRDAPALQHRVQDQIGIVEGEPGGGHDLAHLPIHLELPLEHPPAGKAEVDAGVPAQRLDRIGQAMPRHIGRRRAQRDLHRNQLLGDDARILDAPVAEGHVDLLGGEVGGPVV